MKEYKLLNMIIVFAFISVMITGCSSSNIKVYHGPDQPEENLAFIVLDYSNIYKCTYKIFEESNGNSVKLYESTWNANYDYRHELSTYRGGERPVAMSRNLEVLPGKYTVEIKANKSLRKISGSAFREGASRYGNIISMEIDGVPCSVVFDIDAGQTFFVKMIILYKERVTEGDLNNAGENGLIVSGGKSGTYSFIVLKTQVLKEYLNYTVLDSSDAVITSSSFYSRDGKIKVE